MRKTNQQIGFRNLNIKNMKSSILERIFALGGNIDRIKGNSLQEDWESIILKSPLYAKPTDTPWSKAEDMEPIEGLGEFIAEHEDLFKKNKDRFYEQMVDHYFSESLEHEPNAQSYCVSKKFTPFTKGTADFEEWDGIIVESKVRDLIEGDQLDFMQIMWSYSYPDFYFICLSDPNPANPIVYGTDHEDFFSDIEPYGTLEQFLNRFYTKKELIQALEDRSNS